MKHQKDRIKKKHTQSDRTSQEEMLDIVDQYDQVITSLPRSVVYQDALFSQMRSVWLLLKNKKGQLWIPRRAYDRPILPGHLDGSVVGHVQAGETYEQALIRETKEEVGFDITDKSYTYLGKLTPSEHNTFCFAAVYECVVKVAPRNWNTQEFCEWFWISPQKLQQAIQAGEKVKSALPIILKNFYQIV